MLTLPDSPIGRRTSWGGGTSDEGRVGGRPGGGQQRRALRDDGIGPRAREQTRRHARAQATARRQRRIARRRERRHAKRVHGERSLRKSPGDDERGDRKST